MEFNRYPRVIAAGTLVGLLTLALPASAQAARHVSDASLPATRVATERTVNSGSSQAVARNVTQELSFQERIDAILKQHEEEAKKEAAIPQTVSAYDDSIIGTALASQQQCVDYLLSVNPNPDISVTPQQLVSYYYEEGAREGIRPDVAFAQALKETGFFRYGGTVTSDQNNYCGLGTTSSQVKGAYFNSAQMGVRAQIQHLLAYASTRLPNEPVVDPRYNLVRSSYGERTLKSWPELNGRWAVPGYTYGQSIMSIFRAMLAQ
ncbi:Mannosyl-glycoprotein endo-beta-N-acetylglucosaminidase [Selenomonas ruminantium]|uniref:Mannosyl-glycoprotein endo-beta-N-acetylglucosaminidase n=1 Tax=Selenomonas ruminantium TaxID=971 RepID=A0A1I3BMB8_SELRU|nr:glucosaminidase domain-containing protein [Selenomonas ruminantium]SFH63484.1 Mannosyl-glycoprotein endo-beta-N-acetylglucosaminidase [Selenomonas ruminantium]